MSLEPASPAGSGRSSPIPRTPRRCEDGDHSKRDKVYRRYAAGIEKALSTFETPQQDWADYIAFLGRLLKAIQGIQHIEVLPHSALVSLRLGQCINPTLPSGVHQKAVEVYSTIFAIIGQNGLGRSLQEFLPGFLPLLSFASLTVRPMYYTIFDQYLLQLDRDTLRPAIKSIILSILPGIEDETSEDFEEGLRTLDKLRKIMGSRVITEDTQDAVEDATHAGDGYFWQCFFLATITSASKRQGALAFLTRRLPVMGGNSPKTANGTNGYAEDLSNEVRAIVDPEPGLLIRCFAAGLQDSSMLVQRGYLDLLVTHIPIHSPVLQKYVQAGDAQVLVSAAVTVVLRRDMSLNRRLWSWFLGPDSTGTDQADESQPISPSSEMEDGGSVKQAAYFQKFGSAHLQSCILAMLNRETGSPTDRARPFRIALSLMDRWEVGGSLVPNILLPALDSAFKYSQNGSKKQSDEVIRSASLFFDSVESALIWSKFIEVLTQTFDQVVKDVDASNIKIEFLLFVVQKFNIREEDMLTRHIPNTVLVALNLLSSRASSWPIDAENFISKTIDLIHILVVMIPKHAIVKGSAHVEEPSSSPKPGSPSERCDELSAVILKNYLDMNERRGNVDESEVGECILYRIADLLIQALSSNSLSIKTSVLSDSLSSMITKSPSSQILVESGLTMAFKSSLAKAIETSETSTFSSLNSMLSLISVSQSSNGSNTFVTQVELFELQPLIMENLWLRLSPWEPKYHVETVRLIWQLESLTRSHDRVGAQLSGFLTERLDHTSAEQEECGRFATLWEHTMQSSSSRTDRTGGPLLRRWSSMSNVHDLNGMNPEIVLARPLLALLDCLQDTNSEASTFLLSWLRDLPTLDRVFSVLLTYLDNAYVGQKEKSKHDKSGSRSGRYGIQRLMAIESGLRYINQILDNGSIHVWQTLADLKPDHSPDNEDMNGIQFLAGICINVIRDQLAEDSSTFTSVYYQALPLLKQLLDSQYGFDLRMMHIEESLITILIKLLRQHGNEQTGALQTIFLKTITRALALTTSITPNENERLRSNSNLLQSKSRSTEINRRGSIISSTPPSDLLECIKTGLSSPASRLFLDHWVQFISDVLPLYSDSIFSAMIPLVECFCEQINLAFHYMQATFNKTSFPHDPIPVSALPALLSGLELVLANAQLQLHGLEVSSPVKSTEPAQGFFGSMVSNMSSNMTVPKQAKGNSRLTVILCVQDALKTCFSIWRWASHSIEGLNVDPTSTATLSFNSLKLRHRTKRILEHLFAAESLECLEALVVLWMIDDQGSTADLDSGDVFSLLHTLTPSRPRVLLPAILHSLYSRTNVDALEYSKRSSLTSDLGGLDIVAFLLTYVSTIEDDAMDEIWTDCTTFLKDVLSNPLPHRQVLPALLELVVLLAEKIDNTNIGELRKMHREIGDIFLRLLTATFTTRQPPSDQEKQTGHKGDLVTSLLIVVPKLTSVLETNDRVTAAVNGISTNIVGPMMHTKTFPENLGPNTLELLLELSIQSPATKTWKKEVGDAFGDSRIFQCRPDLVERSLLPVLRKWGLSDRDRVPDLISNISVPTTAGIMFGVGANAARLDADRKTQSSLRRAAILLLSCENDTFMSVVPLFAERLSELCNATISSSPSAATRAEVFMICRALVLSISSVHLSGMWPLMNDILQAAFVSAIPGSRGQDVYNNLSMLQACKLLDLLITVSPDEFQLHEWLYITNTIDAVYRPNDKTPSALVDEVAEELAGDGPFRAAFALDGADVKAMAREDFLKALQPFFAQLSIYAYESVYGMGVVDVGKCRRDLLEDLLDNGTIV